MATEREYLVSLGLAKDGRGRFSAEAKAALDNARKGGMSFDKTAAEIAKEVRESKPKKVRATVSATPKESRPSQDAYDAKSVRSWAESVGMIERGKRGKLPTAAINAYLTANKPQKKVTARKPASKRVAVRTETVGYTFIRRGPKDAAFISEPLVAVETCGRCSKGISFCGCNDGPVAPKYLGGELLLLTRPVK